MIAWRKMELPILLILLMLGFVAYMVLRPYALQLPAVVVVPTALPASQVDTPPVARAKVVVAFPVEHVAVPVHSVFAE